MALRSALGVTGYAKPPKVGNAGRSQYASLHQDLFNGSERGGKSAAIAYTLIETAKLSGVDPQAWLTDVVPGEFLLCLQIALIS